MPTRADPDPDAFRAQRAQARESERRILEQLGAACAAGSGSDCLEWGIRLEAGNERPQADEAWQRACAAGLAEACLLAQQRARPEVFLTALSEHERCAEGQAQACQDLSEFSQRFFACEAGKTRDCAELAYWIAERAGESYARPLWEKACAAGDGEACLFARARNTMVLAYAEALQRKRACRAGRTDACAELQRRAANALASPAAVEEPIPNVRNARGAEEGSAAR